MFLELNYLFSLFKSSLKTVILTAKNSNLPPKILIYNANVADFQKIKTAEIEFPVIFADVLHYEPNELGSGSDIGREGADVLYSEESLKDPEFLESVMRSPFSVATHEKNTSESNRLVDGWPTKVWYDTNKKAVMAKGYVSGAENIEYIQSNKTQKDFGTSAFIDFVGVRKQNGVSTTGKQYSAITTKLICNHVAILPNIRDSKNIIVAMNSLEIDETKENVKNSFKKISSEKYKDADLIYFQDTETNKFHVNYKGYGKSGDVGAASSIQDIKSIAKELIDNYSKLYAKNEKKDLTADNADNTGETARGKNMAEDIDKDKLKNALSEMKNEDKEKDEYEGLKNSVKNMGDRLEKIEGFMKKGNAKNADEGKDDKDDKADNTKNEDGDVLNEDKEDKDEKEIAKNALPSQGLIKDVSDMLDITFIKSPTFFELGKILQVTAKTLPETISAINAKRDEFKKNKPAAQNSVSASAENTNSSFFEALERI